MHKLLVELYKLLSAPQGSLNSLNIRNMWSTGYILIYKAWYIAWIIKMHVRYSTQSRSVIFGRALHRSMSEAI